MKHIKLFENYETLEDLCKKYIDNNTDSRGNKYNKKNIENGSLSYTINGDYVNVVGQFSLDLTEDKIPFKFGQVIGTMFLSGDILTLENSPTIVTGAFNISGCKKVKSLEHGPDKVGTFYHSVYNTQLKDLRGIPKPIRDSYTLNLGYDWGSDNEFLNVCNLFLTQRQEYGGKIKNGEYIIRGDDLDKIELFNEYDIVRDNNVLILDRLNTFLEEIELPTVTDVKGYKCI
jgi:hypothetical protein